MLDEAAHLTHAMVEAFAPFVRSRLDELGGSAEDAVEASIVAGAGWLDEALRELLSKPFPEQKRGPLEVFQEAMRFPTAALVEAGVEKPSRDPVAERAVPGDVYDIVPPSSRALGDEVWTAHMRWGAAKAAAMTRRDG
jgi:hypothetical protein